MTTLFRAIGRTSASEAVREQLVALIQSGELEVGEKLPSEKELAHSFGVSRPVVREALQSLRALGLIVSQSGRGSFVRSAAAGGPLLLGRYPIEHLYEVRLHLEVPGAGVAARRRTEGQLARIADAIERLESCAEPADWVHLDALFHAVLAEATGNGLQLQLVERLRDALVEQSVAVARVSGRIPQANREHRAVYEAVARGDEAGAREAMRIHLVEGQRNWQVLLRAEDA